MLIDFFPEQHRYLHQPKLLFDLACLKINISHVEYLKKEKAARISFKDEKGNIIDVTDPNISIYDFVMRKINEDKI